MWEKRLFEHVEASPWRNGQGITRLLAEDNTHTQPTWRLSVADILHDAPFSTFSGWQRYIALIGDGVLVLQEKNSAWRHILAAHCQPFVFCGQDEVLSSCPKGAVQALNLMVCQLTHTKEIIEFVLHEKMFSLHKAGHTKRNYFLFPATGCWVMRSAGVEHTLTPGSVWHCTAEKMQPTVLDPVKPGSSLYCIRT